MAAVEIHCARSLVALGILVGLRLRMGASVSVVLVLVVTEVSGTLDLVLAIRRHCRPTELERKQGEQNDGEKATHGQEFSGYRVVANMGKATVLWGFTTSMRGYARRCGSSHGG
ncbi:MAG: hypothetical protein Q8K45_01950 [Rubrivivax sp.]|nr:hypothetical protein [Rubrivivax sp.]